MKNKILFRVDANRDIGMGHYYRCFALAQLLIKDFDVIFIMINPIKEIKQTLKKSNIQLISLNKNFVNQNPAHELECLLDNSSIVILDGYNFTTNYQQAIKDLGLKLICIDDLHNRHYISDIVINHLYGLNPAEFSKESYTKLFLGFDYAMLRKSFYSQNEKSGNDILICFGGSDPYNLTHKICTILEEIPSSNVHVVVGSNYQYLEEIKAFIELNQKFILYYNLDDNELVELMKNCTTAIVPSSGILIESLSQNLKIISGYYTVNQKEFYAALIRDKMILGVGNFLDKDRLKNTLIQQIKKSKSFQSPNIDFTSVPNNYNKLIKNLIQTK